jgi:hypothetical protein
VDAAAGACGDAFGSAAWAPCHAKNNSSATLTSERFMGKLLLAKGLARQL